MRLQGGYDIVAFHETNFAQLGLWGQPLIAAAARNWIRLCGEDLEVGTVWTAPLCWSTETRGRLPQTHVPETPAGLPTAGASGHSRPEWCAPNCSSLLRSVTNRAAWLWPEPGPRPLARHAIATAPSNPPSGCRWTPGRHGCRKNRFRTAVCPA